MPSNEAPGGRLQRQGFTTSGWTFWCYAGGVRFSLLLTVPLVIAGCDRKHREADTRTAAGDGLKAPTSPAPAPAPAAAARAATADASCSLAPITLRYPAPRRLVAIGDVHGDLAATRAALRLAGAIDERDRWIGNDLVVVQTGDVLDRGDDEQAILDLVTRLEAEAQAAGGALLMLLGNHELMNAAGDFRYVTPGAMADFDDAPGVDPKSADKAPPAIRAHWDRIPEQVRGRLVALGPGGVYAKRLAEHGVIAIVGDTVFSHAGVIGDWVTQVDAANQTARCWLDGQAGGIEAAPPVLTDDDGPVWTRAYGVEQAECGAAKAALEKLGAKRMVVGHTVQQQGINGVCDGAVWRIDVGLARGYGGPLEVLELVPGAAPKVLRGTR